MFFEMRNSWTFQTMSIQVLSWVPLVAWINKVRQADSQSNCACLRQKNIASTCTFFSSSMHTTAYDISASLLRAPCMGCPWGTGKVSTGVPHSCGPPARKALLTKPSSSIGSSSLLDPLLVFLRPSEISSPYVRSPTNLTTPEA